MNQQHISKYIISIFLMLVFSFSFSQEEETKDSIVIKNKYGIRVGVDLSNPITSFINKDRKGFEIVGDYRITKNWYAATELGYLKNTSDLDNLNFTTTGQYIKLGADYNVYDNWLDMDNLVYLGIRYGFSTFSQKLNSANIFSNSQLPQQTVDAPKEFTGLTAHWAEVVLGIKVEVLNNFFLGFSFSGKRMLSTKQPSNFKNLYAPGFNRVFLNNSGFGFNYTVSYLIPLYKRAK